MNKIIFLIVTLISSKGFSAKSTPTIVVSLFGKGNSMAADIGVIKALHQYLVLREGKQVVENEINFYFAGSSSGAILATYFACYGINEISIEYIIEQATKYPKEFSNEDVSQKSFKMLLGINPEESIKILKPIRDLGTGSNTCRPKLPVLTVAANLDKNGTDHGLDGRVPGKFSGFNGKKIDMDHFTLLNSNGIPVQKICTYLANETMANLLRTIDPKERKCDLRVISDDDLSDEFYILPSVSEPTYFSSVPEKKFNKIESDFRLPTQRSYLGGWVDIGPVQDIVRALASQGIETWTFGTGRTYFARSQEAIIRNMFYDFSLNTNLLTALHWVSLSVPFTKEDWARLGEKQTTPSQQIDIGYASAQKCFNGNANCVPPLTHKPFYHYDAQKRPITVKKGFY